MRIYEIYATPAPLLGELEENKTPGKSRIVAAFESCFCFIIVAAVIVLGPGALFLLFVLLYSQTVAKHAGSFPFSREACKTAVEMIDVLLYPISSNSEPVHSKMTMAFLNVLRACLCRLS